MAANQAITTLTTGTHKLIASPGFQAIKVTIRMSGNRNHNDTGVRFSLGTTDGVSESCSYFVVDGGLSKSDTTTSKMVSLWGKSGSSLVELVSASNVDMNADGNVYIDVAQGNTNYQAVVDVEG